MALQLNELRTKRAGCTAKAREVAEKASKENRDMSADEKATFDKWMTDHKTIGEDIKRLEDLEIAEKLSEEIPESEERGAEAVTAPEKKAVDAKEELRASAYTRYLANGKSELNKEELRALQSDSAVSGGYLVAPQQWVNKLIQTLDKMVFIRSLVGAAGNIFQVPKAASLGAPSLEADPADAVWTAEIKTGDEDSTLSFGKRELFPHPLAKRLKVSNKLIQQALLNVDEIVRSRLAYKFARPEENCFINGTGAGQPLGFMTASADGVPTTQDQSVGNTATTIAYEGIKRALYKMAAEYRANARWLFHSDAVLMLALIVDSTGRYLWTDSVRDGEPDRLFGKPVDVSDLMPNTFTANSYVGCLWNPSCYWIADALSFQIQVLDQLYAETNQIGYIGRKETDGMPVDKNGFVRVKLTA